MRRAATSGVAKCGTSYRDPWCEKPATSAGFSDATDRECLQLAQQPHVLAKCLGDVFGQHQVQRFSTVMAGHALAKACVDVVRAEGVHGAGQRVDDQPADQATEQDIAPDIPAVGSTGDRNGARVVAFFAELDGIALAAEVRAIGLFQGHGRRRGPLKDFLAMFVGNQHVRLRRRAVDRDLLVRIAHDAGAA